MTDMVWTNSSGNPYRLYRDTERGLLAGVCAGIADYIGVEPMLVRLAAALGLLFFFFPTVITYVALAFLLKPKPPALFHSRDEEAFWRGLATAPSDTVGALTRKFGDLDRRLAHMESQVTSSDFELHRKFRDLDR